MLKWVKQVLSKIKHRPIRWFVVTAFGTTFLAVVFLVAILTYTYTLGPPPLTNQQNTVYYGTSGQVIGEEHGLESRYWISLDDIDPQLIEATLMTEDQDFYDHIGFDFKRIIAAAIEDIRSMSMAQGASTITQQYARNLYLSHDKTWKRKIEEALFTIRLEMFYDKDEILEGYLNTIYYGHGAYGIEAASRYFFDTSASDLTLAEASILAGIPKGPSYYSPFHDLENAKDRQERILSILVNEGKITEEEQLQATNQQLNFTEPEDRSDKHIGPYFQDIVFNELKQVLDEDMEQIKSGGYQVYTTLDVEKQNELETQIGKTFNSETELQVGAMALDPKSGAIRSLVGGRDYEESQYNRVVQAKRMPGSTFKPFLYYAALENGYTATTALKSEPTNFELANGKVYQPSNYNGYYAEEPITLAQALALSDNIYAVKTNLFLKPEKLVETAHRFGIKSELQPVPSLALGTETVSVEEMVSAYGMIANGGKEIEPYTIEKVTDIEGNVIYERPNLNDEPVLDPRHTFILANLMTGMFDHSLDGYMQVTGATIADDLSRTYAGKSGTTNTDSWMIGFSPNLVTGVWTGYDNNAPIERVEELQYAKQVWAGFMEETHKDQPIKNFEIPDGVVGAYIDPTTGDLATPYCEDQRLMYFVEGTEPSSYCDLHKPEDKEIDEEKEKEEDEDKSMMKRFFDWLPFGGDN